MTVERARLGDPPTLNLETWEARQESRLVVPGEAFTVVTWNVYEGSDPGVIGDRHALMNPAIAIYQQVSRKQLEELRARFPQYHGSFIETAYHRNGLVEGNLTLSRFPIETTHHEILHRGARAPWKGGRAAYQIYLETVLRLNDNISISVANVRAARLSLSSVTSGGRETQILLDIIKRRMPDILGGDISSLPKWDRMRQIFEDTDLRNTGPDLGVKTWVGGKKVRKKSGLTRADYLLAGARMTFDPSEVGDQSVSDHKPIIGRLATT